MACMASSAIWSLWGIAIDEAHTALKGSSHQGYWLTVRCEQYLETCQYLLEHPAVLCAGILGAALVVVCQYLTYRLIFGADVWCRYLGMISLYLMLLKLVNAVLVCLSLDMVLR